MDVHVLGRPFTVAPRLRPVVAHLRALRRESADDRLTGLAAEVAFFAVLGIFPSLLALAAALGFLQSLLGGEVADRAQAVVTEFMRTFLTDEASATVDAVRALFEERTPGLLSFAAVGAVWAMFRTMRTVMRALTVVYDLEETRSPLRLAGVSLGLALSSLLVAALTLTMFVLGPLLGGGEVVADVFGLGDVFEALWGWARFPLGFAVLVLWAAMVFHVAPSRRTAFRADVPGAIVTGVLWLLFTGGLRLYLGVAGGANQVLGVIGGMLTVLLWMYLLSLALLIGAEVNLVLGSEDAERSPDPA